MPLVVPEPSLVALVGPSGCGKSTFARAHFRPTEVVSSDACRALVADDENDQSATADAFALLRHIVSRRLARGRLTVVDATNVQPRARRELLELARRAFVPAVAIVLDVPEAECRARHARRADRAGMDPEVIARQRRDLDRSLPRLASEGFEEVHLLRGAEAVEGATIEREPLPTNRCWDHGPLDVIGDVHGCAAELETLLARLGYERDPSEAWRHPGGRRAVFVGDLADRGPRIADAFRIAMRMTAAGTALAIPGNHDDKLMRALRGRPVQIAHGLADSLEQLGREPAEFRAAVERWIASLPSHYVFDDCRLVVTHAGLPEAMQGRVGRRVRDMSLYGETTGGTDELGLPVRVDWAQDYRGSALVVYGHTPVLAPRWVGRTVDIDTGCVFGGALSALRWPEEETVSVPAERAYAESRRWPPPPAPAPTGAPSAPGGAG